MVTVLLLAAVLLVSLAAVFVVSLATIVIHSFSVDTNDSTSPWGTGVTSSRGTSSSTIVTLRVYSDDSASNVVISVQGEGV